MASNRKAMGTGTGEEGAKKAGLLPTDFCSIFATAGSTFWRQRRFLSIVFLLTQLPLLAIGIVGFGMLSLQAKGDPSSDVGEGVLEPSKHPADEKLAGVHPKGPEAVKLAASVVSFVVFFLIVAMASVLATLSMTTYTVACDLLGREPSVGQSFRIVRKTLLRMVGTGVAKAVVGMVVGLVYALLMLLPIMGIAAYAAPKGGLQQGAPNIMLAILVLVLVLEIVSLCIIMVYLEVALSLGLTVTVVEQSWGFDALRRSHALTKGSKVTTFGVILVLGAVYFALQSSTEAALHLSLHSGPALLLYLGLLISSVAMNLFGHVVRVVLYISCRSKQGDGFGYGHLADFVEDGAGPGFALLPVTDAKA